MGLMDNNLLSDHRGVVQPELHHGASRVVLRNLEEIAPDHRMGRFTPEQAQQCRRQITLAGDLRIDPRAHIGPHDKRRDMKPVDRHQGLPHRSVDMICDHQKQGVLPIIGVAGLLKKTAQGVVTVPDGIF